MDGNLKLNKEKEIVKKKYKSDCKYLTLEQIEIPASLDGLLTLLACVFLWLKINFGWDVKMIYIIRLYKDKN